MTNLNPVSLDASALLSMASDQESAYDWSGAVELYKKALTSKRDDKSFAEGVMRERLSYTLFRWAMQAASANVFRERMRHAVASYEKACQLFRRPDEQARSFRCQAMTSYLSFWLASKPSEKKRLMDESWKFTKESLNAFENSEDAREYARTYNQLSMSSELLCHLQWKSQDRERTIGEAVEYGERAITFLSDTGEIEDRTKAFVRTACYLDWDREFAPEKEWLESGFQKAQTYWLEAKRLSEETALIEVENGVWRLPSFLQSGPESLSTSAALIQVRKTQDRFIVGSALDRLANLSAWMAYASEDPHKRSKLAEAALKHANESRENFSVIGFQSPIAGRLWVESPIEIYWDSALFETDRRKRHRLLEGALEAAPELLKRAIESGYPAIIQYAHHVFSKILASLASIETAPGEKKRLLEKALEHRDEDIRILDRIHSPSFAWIHGVAKNYRADIKSELAEITKDLKAKKVLLRGAIQDKETVVKLREGEVPFKSHPFAALGQFQRQYGDLLTRFYEITKDPDHLANATGAYYLAAESFRKLDLASRVAECYWRAAQAHDMLGDHVSAAENFSNASLHYRKAAKDKSQMRAFYQDHSIYMEAWSQIQKARYYHRRQECGQAKEFYAKAAAAHRMTEPWKYLAPNYSAWAEIENAEDMSNKERSDAAIHAFENASLLFEEGEMSLRAKLRDIENLHERQMVTGLIRSTNLRQRYCKARVILEGAKVIDKQGNHSTASEKFAQAANLFKRASEGVTSHEDRKEMRLAEAFSSGWATMTKAEAEASPELFEAASRLFNEAKGLSSNERTTMLSLGHSRLCKALGATTKFTHVREEALYKSAMQYLQTATEYYLKGGFQIASEYTKATKLLLEAQLLMARAGGETDETKKVYLYGMVEKALAASADSYQKAGDSGKRGDVLTLLDKIREEREFALSLVAFPPSITSENPTFSAPTFTQERAIGVERFEHADVRVRVILRQRRLRVGEALDIEVELANLGSSPAQLIRLEKIVPEGFDLEEAPRDYRVDDNLVNLKGKHLGPSKTERMRFVLRARVQGLLTLTPRILYMDENGKQKYGESEPLEIPVSPILDFLAKCFVDDFFVKKLSPEYAGWRKLMDVVRALKIPRSHVYPDARYKRAYAKPIEVLVTSGLVEVRIFPGERGRGGQILKLRIRYDKEAMKRFVDKLADEITTPAMIAMSA